MDEELKEGMCKDCGKVAINNAQDERCPECQMEYLEYCTDKYREQ